MELIIESGATKTDYCLIDSEGVTVRRQGEGMNLSTMDMDTVSRSIRDAVSFLDDETGGPGWKNDVAAVRFYGAGLVDRDPVLQSCMHAVFPDAVIEMNSDLMAAARAVCGTSAGIAAILGTGSNSCLYDGKEIVRNIRPCGYILGDFGSGAALGKEFLADCLQGVMPAPLAVDFSRRFSISYSSAVASVYGGTAPARFLASFAPYILSVCRGEADECIQDAGSRSYALELARENFRRFIRRCILPYGAGAGPVGIVGSFGYAFRDILEDVAAEEGICISGYMASPMDGLAVYHAARISEKE